MEVLLQDLAICELFLRCENILTVSRHDGGSKMMLFINGKEVCTSHAIYGRGGDNNAETIHEMTACPVISFKKGDILSMQSVYDLSQHPL